MNLTSEFDSEAFHTMHQVVDPYGEHRHCGSLETAVKTAITAASHHHSPIRNHLLHTTPPAYCSVYRDRLTMPKLIICTGGDEFFQPDDSIFYWSQLKEPKFIRWAAFSSIQCASRPHKWPHLPPYGRTLPNAEHSCAGHSASIYFDARAFYTTILLVSHLAAVAHACTTTLLQRSLLLLVLAS